MAGTTGDSVKATDMFRTIPFTPTWTAVTVGSGAENEGWYQQIGSFVLWGFRLEFGTSPSLSGEARIALPVDAYDGGGTALQACLGTWIYRDASAPINHWSGSMGLYSGGQCSFAGAWDGTAPRKRINATDPFVVALNDVLSGTGYYRAA
jgi:hypothetical protein